MRGALTSSRYLLPWCGAPGIPSKAAWVYFCNDANCIAESGISICMAACMTAKDSLCCLSLTGMGVNEALAIIQKMGSFPLSSRSTCHPTIERKRHIKRRNHHFKCAKNQRQATGPGTAWSPKSAKSSKMVFLATGLDHAEFSFHEPRPHGRKRFGAAHASCQKVMSL